MKELKSIIARYIEEHQETRPVEAAEWFKSEHADLWQDYMEEAASKQLLDDVKRVCNESHTKAALNDLQSEMPFVKQVMEACPNLPKTISFPENGSNVYVKWWHANDPQILSDIADDNKRIEDYQAKTAVKESLRSVREEMGVPRNQSIAEHFAKKRTK